MDQKIESEIGAEIVELLIGVNRNKRISAWAELDVARCEARIAHLQNLASAIEGAL